MIRRGLVAVLSLAIVTAGVAAPLPASAAAVRASVSFTGGAYLVVDVNPGLSGTSAYRVDLQRLSGRSWVKVGSYTTSGTAETVRVAAAQGVYRAVVAARTGVAGTTSAAFSYVPRPVVTLAGGSRLTLDVDPNLPGTGAWGVTLQRRSGAAWVRVGSYATRGSTETLSFAVPHGTYRVLTAANGRFPAYAGPAFAYTPPLAPTSVTAVGGNGSALVSWAAPSTVGAGAATSYTVTSRPGGASCTATATHCTVTGLTNGTAYSFWVTAANSTGVSPVSTGRLATLATGAEHSCVLDPAGAASCWGSDASGQVGNDELNSSAVYQPSTVAGGHVFTAVAAGGSHTCGLTTAGAGWCWGSDSSGQLGDSSTDHAMKTMPVAVTGGHVFVALVAGSAHTCGLDRAGAAWCWGAGFTGQLGSGAGSANAYAPTLVAGGHTFTTLAAGDTHTCALDRARAAWCWGDGTGGRLGDGTTAASGVPKPVIGLHVFASITAGAWHTCALDLAGAAWCWGLDGSGQLGDGAPGPEKDEPMAVVGGHSFAGISASGQHTCGVELTGAAWCWGSNTYGEIGTGTWGDFLTETSPVAVAGGHRFEVVSAGGGHTCGLDRTGRAWCWGNDVHGELGDATWSSIRATPIAVSYSLSYLGPQSLAVPQGAPTPPTAVAATPGLGSAAVSWTAPVDDGGSPVTGYTVTSSPGGLTCTSAGISCTVSGLALGSAYTFTVTASNVVAESVASAPSAPVTPIAPPSAPLGVVATAGAASASVSWLVPATDGGSPITGYTVTASPGGKSCATSALGCTVTGLTPGTTYAFSVTATTIAGISTPSVQHVGDVVSGGTHSCALDTAGAAWCWGSDAHGQLGDGPAAQADTFVPTAVSGGHAFSTLSAGESHTCGLDATGGAWCWGSDARGQLGDGPSSSADAASPVAVAGGHEFISISAGASQTCGIDTAAGLWCWGRDADGEVGDGALDQTDKTSPVLVSAGRAFSQVSTGTAHTCAVDALGAAWCWGLVGLGELGIGTPGLTSHVYEPQQVVGGQVFASVGAGRFHSCGLDVAGAAWCWGDDIAGQLGIPSSGADLRYQPTAVAGGHTFASLTVGSDNSCGTELSGTTWCWGFDLQGQVGDGSVGQQPYVHAAAMVDGSHQLSEVGSGGDHSCAVDRSKALWCWGSDAHGQLGDGPADQSDRFSPVPVTGGLVVRGPTNVAVPTA